MADGVFGKDGNAPISENTMNFDYYYGIEAEQFSFYRVPRLLIKDERFKGLSSDAKLLYGLMLDRMSLSMKNGWLDDENRAYIIYTVDAIMNDLGCSKPTCTKIMHELDSDKGIGLIEKKRRGLGKADIIYVKKFASVPNEKEAKEPSNTDVSTEVKNFNFKKQKNLTFGSKKNIPQEVNDFVPNYINQSYNDMSYTNPINQSRKNEDGCDYAVFDVEEQIEETLMCAVEDELSQNNGIPYSYAIKGEKMKDALCVMAGWNEFAQFYHYDKSSERVYVLAVECLYEMATSTKSFQIGNSHISYKNVIDQINKIYRAHKGEGQSLMNFLSSAVEKFVNASRTREISHSKAYMKMLLWNNFCTFEVDWDCFFNQTYYAMLDKKEVEINEFSR